MSLAVGAGNFLAGLLGGLPMIAEVVRSSANLNAEAQTRWANIFHGLFIAFFAFLLPQAIHLIPTAALSGLLVFTGFRLASPKHWKEAWHRGPEQFVVFAITVVMTVCTDLLTGVGVGLFCELALNIYLARSVRKVVKAQVQVLANPKEESQTRIDVHSSITFANLMPTIGRIRAQKAQNIVVDVSRSRFIDATAMAAMAGLMEEMRVQNRDLTFEGLDFMKAFSHHPTAARFTPSDKSGAPAQ